MGDEESAKTSKIVTEGVGGKCVSVEDLNDALRDDTDESEAEGKNYIFLLFISKHLNLRNTNYQEEREHGLRE